MLSSSAEQPPWSPVDDICACNRYIYSRSPLLLFSITLERSSLLYMSSDFALLSLAAVAASAIAFVFLWNQKRGKYPLPPGPTPKPIVGNMFDMPTGKTWIKYLEWSKQYNSTLFIVLLIPATKFHYLRRHRIFEANEYAYDHPE